MKEVNEDLLSNYQQDGNPTSHDSKQLKLVVCITKYRNSIYSVWQKQISLTQTWDSSIADTIYSCYEVSYEKDW